MYRYITDKQFSHIISYITDRLNIEDKCTENESILIFNLFGGTEALLSSVKYIATSDIGSQI